MTPICRPDRLEIATGTMLGLEPGARAIGDADRRFASVRAAVEAAVEPALARPPCVVAFSGGRDSSVVLAVAAAVAARTGHRPPIPATLVFSRHSETQEEWWQRRVLEALGLDDWCRIPAGDELDLLGPVAAGLIRRHGVLYPANAHLSWPLVELATGGSLLTGAGGDEVFGTTVHPWLGVIAGHRRRRLAALRWLPSALFPRPVRGRRNAATRLDGVPWLTAPARARARARMVEARGPLRWAPGLRSWPRERSFLALAGGLDLPAADRDVRVATPFLSRAVLAAVADDAGYAGYPSRAVALERHFGDLLPADVLRRTSKAVFDGPMFGPSTRDFLSGWTGDGLDAELVDVDAFLAYCRAPAGPMPVAMALQAAAFNTRGPAFAAATGRSR